MTEVTGYSLGIDLGQTSPSTAIARGDTVEMVPPDGGAATQLVDTNDRGALVRHISNTIEQVTAREGTAPSAVVLSLPKDRLAANQDLAAEVARRLGLQQDRVLLVDELEMAALGRSRALEAPTSAVAIGAAMRGAAITITTAAGGLLAAGAGGAVAGGLGAALLGGEPTAAGATGTAGAAPFGPPGVPLGSAAGVGPAGVPLGQSATVGPAGVPMGPGAAVGPSGVPVGAGAAVGPSGVPMPPAPVAPPAAPIKAPRTAAVRHRVVLIGGAVAAVAVVAVVAVIAASPGDSPATVATPAPTEASLLAAVTAPTETPTTVTTDVVATTPATSTSTVAAAAPGNVAPTCVVGSWLADNKSLVTTIIGSSEQLGGYPFENGDVTGEARLDIAADGTVVTTFDNWVLTSALPEGVGSATIAETGTETHSVSFAADGSYSITAASSGSRLTLTLVGSVLFDSPLPSGVLASPGTYTCTADQLVIVEPHTGLTTETFNRNG